MPHAGELWAHMGGEAQSVTLGQSPASWSAPRSGSVVISGGVLSGVTLTRGGVSAVLPLAGVVPVSPRDSLTIIYTTVPSVKFFPG